ncbi:hypothetical protein PCE1_001263 [Barthelona sp. PCE]
MYRTVATGILFALYFVFGVATPIFSENIGFGPLFSDVLVNSRRMSTEMAHKDDIRVINLNSDKILSITHHQASYYRPGGTQKLNVLVATGVGYSPKRMRFLEPLNGCQGQHLNTAVKTLERQGCLAGSNAGFFGMDNGMCLGNAIFDGYQQIFGGSNTNIGVLKDGRLLVGYMQSETIRNTDIDTLIQGIGWLVRDGENYVAEAREIEHIDDIFADEFAPRVALGVTADGVIKLVQAEGFEPELKGLSLHQFADFLVTRENIQHAVNLDGGGSTTLMRYNTLLNKCSDECFPFMQMSECGTSPNKCLRRVSSVLCFKDT